MKIRISNKKIGDKEKTFIVAEAGINHNGRVKIAKELVQKAYEIEADAIKFQTFKADDIASKKSKYYKLFSKLELSDHEFEELNDYAKKIGIIFLSTPFSLNAVDFLDKINIPAFKIASGDLTNIPLIKHIGLKNKPVILSTGMSDQNEIKYAIKTILKTNNKKIILLHSVSSYPTPPNETNLKVLTSWRNIFKYPLGYSDNGSNNLVPQIAVSLGAKFIEKHFTLSRKMKGPDHQSSADPQQFKKLITNIRLIEKMMGDGKKICQKSELDNRINARRSITAIKEIKKGTQIKEDMISMKRPATGIEPKFMKKIIGKITTKNIKADYSINWKDLS
jgi:N,N'-diacetyllegionaminate synthase